MKTILTSLFVSLAISLLLTVPARHSVSAARASIHAVAAAAPAAGMDSATTQAKLALTVLDGDSVWNVRATLTGIDSAGNRGPIANATVSFYVKRLFGLMPMRSDDNTATTDDSGNAEIQMRKNIPGGTTGRLTILARLEGNDQTGMIAARDTGAWGTTVPVLADPFPRALWEPNAPISMIIVFSILFGGVWATYGFVIKQLVSIKKEKHHAV